MRRHLYEPLKRDPTGARLELLDIIEHEHEIGTVNRELDRLIERVGRRCADRGELVEAGGRTGGQDRLENRRAEDVRVRIAGVEPAPRGRAGRSRACVAREQGRLPRADRPHHDGQRNVRSRDESALQARAIDEAARQGGYCELVALDLSRDARWQSRVPLRCIDDE